MIFVKKNNKLSKWFILHFCFAYKFIAKIEESTNLWVQASVMTFWTKVTDEAIASQVQKIRHILVQTLWEKVLMAGDEKNSGGDIICVFQLICAFFVLFSWIHPLFLCLICWGMEGSLLYIYVLYMYVCCVWWLKLLQPHPSWFSALCFF